MSLATISRPSPGRVFDGIADLGFPNLFVFVDESAPMFQWVVIDLFVEGRLVSRCAFSP